MPAVATNDALEFVVRLDADGCIDSTDDLTGFELWRVKTLRRVFWLTPDNCDGSGGCRREYLCAGEWSETVAKRNAGKELTLVLRSDKVAKAKGGVLKCAATGDRFKLIERLA